MMPTPGEIGALAGAAAVAGLVGGLHCVGMCGPLVGVCATGEAGARRGAADRGVVARAGAILAGPAAYHGGRLAGYLGLGAVAGLAGAALDGAVPAGLGGALAVAAGTAMILWGAAILLRASGLVRVTGGAPRMLVRVGAGALGWARRRRPAVRSLAVGLATPLLPCGWLWLFVAAAAATAHPVAGAAVLAGFWAGTVPALLALGVGLRVAAAGARRALPIVSAVVLIAAGGVTLWTRLPAAAAVRDVVGADATATAAENAAPTAADAHAETPGDHVHVTLPDAPPCCPGD